MSQENTTEREKFTAPDRRINTKMRERLVNVVRYGGLAIVSIYLIFPLYWIIISGFKPRDILFSSVTIIPTQLSLGSMTELFTTTIFPRFVMNSIITTTGATVTTVTFALLGGYGLARSEFQGQRNLARVVLFTYMFPQIVIGIPLYIIFYNLGLLNSYIALIAGHTAIALPFCLWLMWQFFQTIPIAFEESAWIAGASRWRTFRDVVLPMAVPGMIAVSIFAFAVSWSDFTIARILLTDRPMQTFPVGINMFLQTDRVSWGMLTAAGTVIMIPSLLLVYFLQRYILIGFAIGE